MKRTIFFIGLVPAALALFFSCASGPQLESPEQPEIVWSKDYEYAVMAPAEGMDDAIVLATMSLRKEDNIVRILDVRTGELIQEINSEELEAMKKEARESRQGGNVLGQYGEMSFNFPAENISVTIPPQRAGLIKNNINKPVEDIIVSELSSGKELLTITRKGLVFDCAVTGDSILFFYQLHTDVKPKVNILNGNKENGALVKHSLKTGEEQFIAEVNFMMEKKVESLAQFYLSGGLWTIFYRNDYNFSGIIVDGDMAYLSSAGISAVDLNSGKEAWTVKNDVLTGEKAMSMVQGNALFGAATFVADVDPAPVITGNSLIYRDVKGTYYCVDKNTGSELWKKKIGWSDSFTTNGSDTMYVSLGLQGFDGNGKLKANGRPGFAAYKVSDGAELWSHKFKDPIIGMIDNAEGNGALLFSGLKILDINFQTGELTEKLDIKKDWGLKDPPVFFNNGLYENEALLFFEDRIVWVDAVTAEKTAEFDFGMSAESGNFSIGYSLYRINNSLLLEIPKKGIVYLYVLNDKTRSLKYFEEIYSSYGQSNYLKYPALGLYLLGHDKKGRAGAMQAVDITAYKIK
jgi:hypothetical protein